MVVGRKLGKIKMEDTGEWDGLALSKRSLWISNKSMILVAAILSIVVEFKNDHSQAFLD